MQLQCKYQKLLTIFWTEEILRDSVGYYVHYCYYRRIFNLYVMMWCDVVSLEFVFSCGRLWCAMQCFAHALESNIGIYICREYMWTDRGDIENGEHRPHYKLSRWHQMLMNGSSYYEDHKLMRLSSTTAAFYQGNLINKGKILILMLLWLLNAIDMYINY